MIPEAVSMGLFKDTGALITALLVAGRAGAGIGAQLAGMRVTEQIDALETLGVNSFKYLGSPASSPASSPFPSSPPSSISREWAEG